MRSTASSGANFLGSFSNVKTLRIEDGLIKELSRCLRLEDGEHPLELLPELQELTYSGSGDVHNAFASLIDARRNAGSPVNQDSHTESEPAGRSSGAKLPHNQVIERWLRADGLLTSQSSQACFGSYRNLAVWID
jgi:hypothetical protein